MKGKGKKKGGMKYFYSTLIVGLLSMFSVSAQNSVFSTNILTANNSWTFVLLTNRTLVKSVTLTGGANAVTARFFDEDRNADPYWGTNYVAPAYVSIASYPTTIVNTVISETGYTNYWTNSYRFTYSVTNSASTNALSPILAVASAANQQTAKDNLNVLGIRGITVQVNTNATLILEYTGYQ